MTKKTTKPYVTRCEDIAIISALIALAILFAAGRFYG
jgi:hypothetical protein